jgi:hypothetical protein
MLYIGSWLYGELLQMAPSCMQFISKSRVLTSILFLASTCAFSQIAPAPRSAIESAGRSLNTAVAPPSNAVGGAAHEVAKGLIGNMGDEMTANANRNFAESLYLKPHDLRFTGKANCSEHVDLILATGQIKYATPQLRTSAIEGVIYKGYLAGCIAQKTTVEKIPPGIRAYYDEKRRLVLGTQKCSGYGQRADQLVLSHGVPEEIKLALVNLFVSAREAQCMR